MTAQLAKQFGRHEANFKGGGTNEGNVRRGLLIFGAYRHVITLNYLLIP
jgi:hypothetical protein